MAVPGGEPSGDEDGVPTRIADPAHDPSPMAGKASDVRPAAPSSPSASPGVGPAPVGESIRRRAQGDRPGKSAKLGKPDYEEFVSQVEAIISSDPPKGAVAALIKLVKAGFSDGVEPDHLDRLLESLRSWPDCSRLALNLYIETRKKHSPELMRSLRNRLLAHARTVAGYPSATDGDHGGPGGRDLTVTKWIEAQLGHADDEPERDPPGLPQVRWILLCLLEEHAAVVRYDAIYGLLDRLAHLGATDDVPHAELDFVTEIGGLFSTDKFDIQRVRAAVRAAGAARLMEQQCREGLQRAKGLLGDAQDRSADLGRVAADLERQLDDARSRLAEREKLCEERGRELEEERRERRLDQEHWQSQGDQRLSRLASSIRVRLGHEIGEAKISLSQETPDVRMALDRLGRIEKALGRLEDE